VAALAVGVTAGTLFGNVLGSFGGVLDRHPSYAMAVAAGAVAAAAAAALLSGLARRLGRWTPAATGMVAGAVLLPLDVLIPPALYEAHEVVFGACVGLALGGALLAAAAAPATGRVAIVAGLATGLLTWWGLLAVTEMLTAGESGLLLLAGSVVAVVAVAAWVGFADRARDRDAFRAPAGRTWPLTAVVVAVAAGTLAAEALRRAAVAGGPLVGTAEARVAARAGIALAAGAVLAVAAYRYGRAAAVRWVATGFGAGLPLLVGLAHGFWTSEAFPQPRPSGVWLLAVAVAAVAAGVVLGSRADRWAPWDALGLLAAAATLWLRTGGPPTTGHHVVLAAGLGVALGAGLSRVVSRPGIGPGPARVAGVAAVGVAAALLVTNPLAPVPEWLVTVDRIPQPSAVVTPALVALGAVVTAVGWAVAARRSREVVTPSGTPTVTHTPPRRPG